MSRAFWVCLLIFGLILSFSMVDARSSNVVPVQGQSTSWDKKISGATRFKLVLDGQAVLDRETGLVWEKSPDRLSPDVTWADACSICIGRHVSGRMGWRLPTIEEFTSLISESQRDPALPAGHPFTNVQSGNYWSSTAWAYGNGSAWYVDFSWGYVDVRDKKRVLSVWCVRGAN